MQCPACQNTDSRVLESRSADAGRSVRRRRECLNCEFRFTTYERIETVPITVLKRNGSRETFTRTKLLNGITKACGKTSLASSEIQLLVEQIEIKLQQKSSREVQSTDIGEMVLEHLKLLNEVAYIRFASVYKKFHGINDFLATLKDFKSNKNELATIR